MLSSCGTTPSKRRLFSNCGKRGSKVVQCWLSSLVWVTVGLEGVTGNKAILKCPTQYWRNLKVPALWEESISWQTGGFSVLIDLLTFNSIVICHTKACGLASELQKSCHHFAEAWRRHGYCAAQSWHSHCLLLTLNMIFTPEMVCKSKRKGAKWETQRESSSPREDLKRLIHWNCSWPILKTIWWHTVKKIQVFNGIDWRLCTIECEGLKWKWLLDLPLAGGSRRFFCKNRQIYTPTPGRNESIERFCPLKWFSISKTEREGRWDANRGMRATNCLKKKGFETLTNFWLLWFVRVFDRIETSKLFH